MEIVLNFQFKKKKKITHLIFNKSAALFICSPQQFQFLGQKRSNSNSKSMSFNSSKMKQIKVSRSMSVHNNCINKWKTIPWLKLMELFHQVFSHLVGNWSLKQSKTSLAGLHVKPLKVSVFEDSIIASSKFMKKDTIYFKHSITKQPVGSQHLRGFGKTLDQMCLAAEIALPWVLWSFSRSMISTHRLINGSCNGLYNSDSATLLMDRKLHQGGSI